MKCKYCNEEMILDDKDIDKGIEIKYWVCYNCGKACTKEIRKADHKVLSEVWQREDGTIEK